MPHSMSPVRSPRSSVVVSADPQAQQLGKGTDAMKKLGTAFMHPVATGRKLKEKVNRPKGEKLPVRGKAAEAPAVALGSKKAEAPRPASPFQVDFVGGGARTMFDTRELAKLVNSHAEFAELGVDINVRVHDRQPAPEGGVGVTSDAWRNQGAGTFNTGEAETASLKDVTLGYLEEKHGEILRTFEEGNHVPGTRMYLSAYEPGHKKDPSEPFAMHRAALSRDMGGEIMGRYEEETRKMMPANVSLQRIYGHEAVGFDMTSDPAKVSATFVDPSTGEHDTVQAHRLVLNTGSDLNPAITGSAARFAYQEGMDGARMQAFAAARGMLDAQGRLKEGDTPFALGGTSLSTIDAELGALKFMPLYRVRGEGAPPVTADDLAKFFKDIGVSDEDAQERIPTLLKFMEASKMDVDLDAARRWQGQINLISRTAGVMSPPRTAFDATLPPDTPELLNTKELHALFLHKQGQEVYQQGYDLIRAAAAAGSGLTPAELSMEGKSTREVGLEYMKSAADHLAKLEEANGLEGEARAQALAESAANPTGRLRVLSNGLYSGVMPVAGGGTDAADVERMAPMTFRPGQPFVRAVLSGISKAGTEAAANNARSMRNYEQTFQYVAASPAHVEPTLGMMLNVGVAEHVEASYEALDTVGEGKDESLVLKTAHGPVPLKGIFVSKTFNPESSPLSPALKAQARPVDPRAPGVPDLVPGRDLQDKRGNPRPVAYSGLAVTGQRVGPSVLGRQSIDQNNRPSGVDVAKTRAALIGAEAILHKAFPQDHYQRLRGLIDARMAGNFNPVAYAQQARHFASHFDDAQVKWHFIQVAQKYAGGNGKVHAALMWAAASRDADKMRKELQLRLGPRGAQAIAEFDEALSRREPFQPQEVNEHADRYVDLPPDVVKQVFEDAVEMSRQVLAERQGAHAPA